MALRFTLQTVARGAAIAFICGGCSVIFHAESSQCSSDGDCAARGRAFDGYTCVRGTCVGPITNIGAGGADASVGSGGSNGLGGNGGGGLGGSSDPPDTGPKCRVASDCPITVSNHQEVACDVDRGSCVQLTTDECAYVLGDYTGKIAPPVFFGGFAKFPAGPRPLSDPSYANYKLAIDEFTKNATGIALGAEQRYPVVVLCDYANLEGLGKATQHLIEGVKTPLIVSALSSADLVYQFTTWAGPKEVMVINAFGADSNLISLQTKGLLWHMLGQAADLAPAYRALLSVVEPYVRNKSPWFLGDALPLRVATVTADSLNTNNLAAAAGKVMTFNGGKTLFENQNGQDNCSQDSNSCSVLLSKSTLNGTPLDDPELIAETNSAATKLIQFAPNVVISFAAEEFVRILQSVELGWNNAQPPPFYIVGPYNVYSEGLRLAAARQSAFPVSSRIAGVNVAASTEAQVLAGYENRLLSANQDNTALLGQENYYDAMYFAVYSFVAVGRTAGSVTTGPALSAGFQRLVSRSATRYEVGKPDQGAIFGALGSKGSIQLVGTLGPPNFDLSTGARVSEGDIYCLMKSDGGAFTYAADVLRLVNSDGSAPDGGTPFTGTFPCFSGLQ